MDDVPNRLIFHKTVVITLAVTCRKVEIWARPTEYSMFFKGRNLFANLIETIRFHYESFFSSTKTRRSTFCVDEAVGKGEFTFLLLFPATIDGKHVVAIDPSVSLPNCATTTESLIVSIRVIKRQFQRRFSKIWVVRKSKMVEISKNQAGTIKTWSDHIQPEPESEFVFLTGKDTNQSHISTFDVNIICLVRICIM